MTTTADFAVGSFPLEVGIGVMEPRHELHVAQRVPEGGSYPSGHVGGAR